MRSEGNPFPPKKWRTKFWVLVHDNAPAHRPGLVKDFLQMNNLTPLGPHPFLSWLQLLRHTYIHTYTSEFSLNPSTPNDHYSGRTAPLTSKLCISYIYSTNTGSEYFKHGIYAPFFLFKMQFVS